jgi:hypothetical protein
MADFDDLSREDLLKVIQVYAKNWLAHDGCWFLAMEEKLSMEAAIWNGGVQPICGNG